MKAAKQRHRQCFVITKRPAAFIAKMAHKASADMLEMQRMVNRPPPNAECGLNGRLHLCQTHHPAQPVSLPERNCPKIVNLLAGCIFSHTALPGAECIEDDEDTEHDTDFNPDMLTDNG